MLAEAPPTVALKPRQAEALAALESAQARGVTRALVQLPTGVGKTLLAAHVAQRFRRVLFLVHREELLWQTIRAFQRVEPGREVGLIWQQRLDVGWRRAVGMIQTVHARLAKLPPNAFDLVICDECQHAGSTTWRRVLDHFEPDLRLGLSATPERNDGAPLSNLFDEVVYAMSVREAVEEHYLCRPIGLMVNTATDLAGIGRTAGDFNQGQLAARIDDDDRNALVARAFREHGAGRRALAFCVTVDHAQRLAGAMSQADLRADWVSGDDPQRRDKLRRLRDGHLDVLCNATLLTEGFDDPLIDCVLMARPTQSRVLYTQAVGRGLRIAPGKRDCLIVDFVDNCERHSLVTVWDFWGQRIPRAAQDHGEVDLLNAGELGARESLAEEHFGELFGAQLNLEVFAQEVDLFAPPPPQPSAWTYGERRWHYDPASEKQLAALARAGYDVRGQDWTKGQAAQLLDGLPATTKQQQYLLALGFDVLTQDWTRPQAGAAIDQARAEGRSVDWSRVHQLRARRTPR